MSRGGELSPLDIHTIAEHRSHHHLNSVSSHHPLQPPACVDPWTSYIPTCRALFRSGQILEVNPEDITPQGDRIPYPSRLLHVVLHKLQNKMYPLHFDGLDALGTDHDPSTPGGYERCVA
ncbi:hypothetical protein E1B28_003165 [Marasmius oreades]|uniref:Uncharacterized protein n=1 Tax=Marasmius oreades TaxID=181124 RepID=A0A9P7RKH4_9AGAR|nr:uncharacterized protein E1B28_003165 [Marasmius oreades]KAG7085616.1 hypothetical protein E1B28_003165 [Marasmius oreades]